MKSLIENGWNQRVWWYWSEYVVPSPSETRYFFFTLFTSPKMTKRQALEQEKENPKRANGEFNKNEYQENDLELENRYDSEFDSSSDDDDEVVVVDGELDNPNAEYVENENDDELCDKVQQLQVYLPGQQLEKDEVLVADQSAYDMLHTMGVEWPCLSFDIIQDKLGKDRTSYPMQMYMVAGSQSSNYNENKIYLMKISKLGKTRVNEESDSDEDYDDEDPVLEFKTLDQVGGTNRIRVTIVFNI